MGEVVSVPVAKFIDKFSKEQEEMFWRVFPFFLVLALYYLFS